MSLYLVVFRSWEVYAPGNWVVDPYWQARGHIYVSSSREDAVAHCDSEKVKIYFEKVPVPGEDQRGSDGTFEHFDHWRIFEISPGSQVDLSD